MTDRTSEFLALVGSLPPSLPRPPPEPPGDNWDSGPLGLPTPVLPGSVGTLQDFHRASAGIAKQIHQCSSKLASLARMVKRKGLFSEPGEEIDGLVHDIKADIQSLNGQLDAAQAYVDSKRKSSGKKNQAASHSVNVVGQLKTELMNTTKSFKDVLQQRSSSLREQKGRRDLFFTQQSQYASAMPVPVVAPVVASAMDAREQPDSFAHCLGPPQGSIRPDGAAPGLLPRPGSVTSQPTTEPDPGDDVPLLIGAMPQHQQVIKITKRMQLIPDSTYLESRSNAMQDVESHIVELGGIFNRLSTMLADQREMVESVHDNVENANSNVNRGQLALMATLRSVSSNALLAAKVSAILGLFIVFFIIFMM
ncbi:unnamed protein product [Chrysoparadoxa australica]